ncbi:MAG: large conductance mechanosensitive channel protein MscL [Eubacterium sp.]|nr:large conductance mechanosensitive channel protein MscL [Eubacterium sp.]
MLKEFKEFALKGNMMDLAVGVIIGGAFKDVVTSLVDNVIMPFVAMFTGKLNFDKWVIPGTAIKYGTFISAVINFIIMAFIIFLMIKAMNKLRRKDEEVTTKVCPHCKSEIDIEATKCPHCTSDVQ